jgi:hypothetical protein
MVAEEVIEEEGARRQRRLPHEPLGRRPEHEWRRRDPGMQRREGGPQEGDGLAGAAEL